jgi:hypothetical protein
VGRPSTPNRTTRPLAFSSWLTRNSPQTGFSVESDSPTQWTDLGLRALAGVAAGAGVLGVVTLVGGAVLHAQLSAAGLPADQAVSDLPRSTLLGVGARILVPFLAAVGVAFLVLFALERDSPDQEQRRHHDDSSRTAPSTQAHAQTAPRSRIVGVAVLWLAGALVVIIDAVVEGVAWWGYTSIFALIGTGFLATWHAAQRGFALFAFVGALAASLFAVSSGYVLSYFLPSVRPVAVVLKSRPPIVGIYAAANKDEVIVGQVCAAAPNSARGNDATGTLIVLPRSDVAALAIGTNGSLSNAIGREMSLLRSLPDASDPTPEHTPRIAPGKPSCTSVATARMAQGEPGLLLGP